MTTPELIFVNGIVRTMDTTEGSESPPSAVAVARGKIVAVGEDSQIYDLANPNSEIIDLAGSALVPGFIETHLHPLMWGLMLSGVDASATACHTVDDVVRALAARADATPPGTMVEAWGFDDSLVAEQRGLTTNDLDAASTRHPIMVRHTSNHAIYLNSVALAEAGITADTPEPEGGAIVRAADGAPRGELREVPAMSLFGGLFPEITLDSARDALRRAQAEMAKVGVTSFHDLFVTAPMLAAYRQLATEGELRLRARLYLENEAANEADGFGTEVAPHLTIGGVKLVSDGSIQLHTAALTQPYSDVDDCHCGSMAMPIGDLSAAIGRHHAAGRSIAIHTNGDRAIDIALDLIETAQKDHPRTAPGHRLEHVQTLRNDQIERMGRLGVSASIFVNHVYYWGDRHRDLFLGPDRGERISPVASVAAARLPYALHCDCPVTPVDPLFTMHTAVHRLTSEGALIGPAERVTPRQALAGYTSEAARLTGDDHDRGRIAPGYRADLVVLDEDPLLERYAGSSTINLAGLRVRRTVVGGETVFAARE